MREPHSWCLTKPIYRFIKFANMLWVRVVPYKNLHTEGYAKKHFSHLFDIQQVINTIWTIISFTTRLEVSTKSTTSY